jgi:hypothetical protein
VLPISHQADVKVAGTTKVTEYFCQAGPGCTSVLAISLNGDAPSKMLMYNCGLAVAAEFFIHIEQV